MGYVSQTSGTGATGGGYQSQTAGVAPQGGHSVLDFLGNVLGGARDATLGLAKLAVAIPADIGGAVVDLIPGVDYDYMTPDIAKGLAAMPQDYWDRYSPLLPGGRPASQILEEVYQKPVSFGLDAVAVAGLAGKAASAAGLSKLGGTEFALGKGLSAEAKALTDVGISGRTAKAATIRTGLDRLAATTGEVAPWWSKLLPEETMVREGTVLTPSTTIRNPLIRQAKASFADRFITETPKAMKERLLVEKSNLGINAPEAVQARINRELSLAQKAEDMGLAKIDVPRVGTLRASSVTKGIRNVTGGAYFRDRIKATTHVAERWKAVRDKASPEEWGPDGAAASADIMGVDGVLDDVPVDEAIKLRIEEEIGRPLAAIPRPKVLTKPILDVISDEARKNLSEVGQDAVLTQADEVLSKIQEHIDQVVSDPNIEIAGWSVERLLNGAERMRDHVISDVERFSRGQLSVVGEGKFLQRLDDIRDTSELWPSMRYTPAMMLDEAYGASLALHGSARNAAESIAAAEAKVETFVGKKASALFNKQEFDQPIGIGDAEDAARGLVDTGEVPGTIKKALKDTEQLTYEMLDDARREAGLQAPTYYPHFDTNRLKVSDWLRESPGMKKSVKLAADDSWKRNEEILFKRGTYMRDPIEVYARRAARSASMDGTVRLIEEVSQRLGRRVGPKEIIGDDEFIMSVEPLRRNTRINKDLYNFRDDNLLKGMSLQDAGEDAMIRAISAAQDELPALAAEGKATLYAVPKVVAMRLNDAARMAGIVPRWAKIYVSGPMNVWRSFVLAGSPRWVVNNIFGNSIFTWMGGASAARAIAMLERRYANIIKEKLGWEVKGGSVKELEAFMDEFGVTEDVKTTYAKVEELSKSNPFDPSLVNNMKNAPSKGVQYAQRFAHGMRSANSEVETAYRSALWMSEAERAVGIGATQRFVGRFMSMKSRLNRLLKNGFDEGHARVALTEMERFLGDFGNLGPFERNVVRPFIFPFWGFTKHVGKLLLSYPFEFPERAAMLSAFANVTQDMTEAYGEMPTWLEGAIPLGPPGDTVKFLTTTGADPFSGLLAGNPLAQLSPLLKVPAEHMLGENLFTGQPFSDKDVFTPFGSDQSFRVTARDANGVPTAVEPVSKVTPSLFEAFLQQLPQYEILKDALAGGKTYDTSGILDVVKPGSRALITDPETGEAKYPFTPQQAIGKMFGYSTVDYGLQQFQEWMDQQAEAALKMAQAQAGA